VDGDLSRLVTVQQSRLGCPDCPACAVGAAAQGACFPGEYTFVYAVADAAGNVATDYVVVKVRPPGGVLPSACSRAVLRRIRIRLGRIISGLGNSQ
jgi:hypothetical protein